MFTNVEKYIKERGIDEEQAKKTRRTAKAIGTNTYNRWVVMTSEDVGAACPMLCVAMDRFDGARDLPSLLSMASLVTSSRTKTRLISSLKSFYALPPYYWKKPGEKEWMLSSLENLRKCYPYFWFEDGDDLVFSMDGFWKEVEKGRVQCFAHLAPFAEDKKVMKSVGVELGKKLKREGRAELEEAVKVLTKWYTKQSNAEKPIHIYNAIIIYLFRNEYGREDLLTPRPGDIDAEGWKKKVMTEGAITFGHEVYDKHTAAGRRTGFGSGAGAGAGACGSVSFFAEHGAKLVREDPRFYIPELKEAYILMKRIIDGRKMTTKEEIEAWKEAIHGGDVEDDVDVEGKAKKKRRVCVGV